MIKFQGLVPSTFVLLLTLSLCSAENDVFSSTGYAQIECLRVPPLEFAGAAKTAVDLVRKAGALVSKFDKKFGNSRVGHAILDCLDLLDSASEELSWIISASQNPNGIKLLHLFFFFFLKSYTFSFSSPFCHAKSFF